METLGFPVYSYLLMALLISPKLTKSTDTIALSQPLRENETLVSAGEKFQLGFFSPGNSGDRYLGIWFYNIQEKSIVWIANRDNPLNGSSGILKIGNDGNLVVVDSTESIIWSSNSMNVTSGNAVAQLLDSGNFVLRDKSDSSSENFLWQSFDRPTDTLLAGMKLGWEQRAGLSWYLRSWKSLDDLSSGDYTYRMELQGLPQKFLRKGNTIIVRSGPWDGIQFSGLNQDPNSIILPEFISTAEEVYYTYKLTNLSTVTRAVLRHTGSLERHVWDEKRLQWTTIHTLPSDACDEYRKCGPNGLCTISNPRICSCLAGYTPKSPRDWDMLIWSGGCVRMKPLNCPKGEGFKELKGVKVPDMLQYWINTSMSLDDCKVQCLKNCSCTAYASADVRGKGKGCMLWFGDLIDIRKLIQYSNNQNVFIRVTSSELGNSKEKIWLVVSIVAASVCLALILLFVIWRRTKRLAERKTEVRDESANNLELPIFDLVSISRATDNFSHFNKIGEGGFGPVYKGYFFNGQPIAVKRLSKNSRQGSDEFKNEVLLIARLQHINLVKLLGCCMDGEERMLIYEYMPNGSLDTCIFGNKAGNSLVWRRRFDIIVGIARGLLYLHRDSRLRIIHRDLKASNVLLDGEMNPKISDFGMARAFGGDHFLEKTRRVVGTYGYMSPEYAIDGIFSTKSDVFSFGVLVLEIISSRRNRDFHHPDHNFNLLGHAWKLWLEGKAIELIDKNMEDSFPVSEAMRCIQIGLLCVQQRPEERPSMSNVLLMLDSESASLPQPNQPGFYTERSHNQLDGSTSELTITVVEGR